MANPLDLVARAKARLLAEAGRFLQYRDRLLRLRDVADAMARKGEIAGRPELRELAARLRAQLDRLYESQINLEIRAQNAVAAFTAPGLPFAALVQAGLTSAPLLRDIAVHVGKVKAAEKATDALKRRTLTAAELDSLSAGGAGMMGLAAVGAVAIGAIFLLRGRRSRK